LFPLAAASSVFEAYARATTSAPPEVSLWATVLHVPDLPHIPSPVRGGSFCAIDALSTAGSEALDLVLDPIRAAGPVLHDTVAPRTPGEVLDICEEPLDPTPVAQFAIPLSRLSTDVIGSLLPLASRAGSFTQVQLRHLAGAPRGRFGVASDVDAEFVAMALAVTPGPDAATAARAAMAELGAHLAPWTAGRVLPSFLGAGESLSASFGREELELLRVVKARLDPHDLFAASVPA
jgi:hypothetical protein